MRRFKRILSIIVVLTVLLGIALLGFIGIFLYSYTTNGGFMLIPQDCILLKRDINGRVQDKNSQSIMDAKLHIYTSDAKGFESGKVDLNLTTDKSGRFSANGIDVFACDFLFFEITANGHSQRKLRFVAAQGEINNVGDRDHYGDTDYATALANGNTPVLPRQLTIELP